MIIQVSDLVPTGSALLKRNGEVVAFGSVKSMCENYRPGFVLVVSRDTEEALHAEFAKDVTPKAALSAKGSS